jgi:hypothetical protein
MGSGNQERATSSFRRAAITWRLRPRRKRCERRDLIVKIKDKRRKIKVYFPVDRKPKTDNGQQTTDNG